MNDRIVKSTYAGKRSANKLQLLLEKRRVRQLADNAAGTAVWTTGSAIQQGLSTWEENGVFPNAKSIREAVNDPFEIWDTLTSAPDEIPHDAGSEAASEAPVDARDELSSTSNDLKTTSDEDRKQDAASVESRVTDSVDSSTQRTVVFKDIQPFADSDLSQFSFAMDMQKFRCDSHSLPSPTAPRRSSDVQPIVPIEPQTGLNDGRSNASLEVDGAFLKAYGVSTTSAAPLETISVSLTLGEVSLDSASRATHEGVAPATNEPPMSIKGGDETNSDLFRTAASKTMDSMGCNDATRCLVPTALGQSHDSEESEFCSPVTNKELKVARETGKPAATSKVANGVHAASPSTLLGKSSEEKEMKAVFGAMKLEATSNTAQQSPVPLTNDDGAGKVTDGHVKADVEISRKPEEITQSSAAERSLNNSSGKVIGAVVKVEANASSVHRGQGIGNERMELVTSAQLRSVKRSSVTETKEAKVRPKRPTAEKSTVAPVPVIQFNPKDMNHTPEMPKASKTTAKTIADRGVVKKVTANVTTTKVNVVKEALPKIALIERGLPVKQNLRSAQDGAPTRIARRNAEIPLSSHKGGTASVHANGVESKGELHFFNAVDDASSSQNPPCTVKEVPGTRLLNGTKGKSSTSASKSLHAAENQMLVEQLHSKLSLANGDSNGANAWLEKRASNANHKSDDSAESSSEHSKNSSKNGASTHRPVIKRHDHSSGAFKNGSGEVGGPISRLGRLPSLAPPNGLGATKTRLNDTAATNKRNPFAHADRTHAHKGAAVEFLQKSAVAGYGSRRFGRPGGDVGSQECWVPLSPELLFESSLFNPFHQVFEIPEDLYAYETIASKHRILGQGAYGVVIKVRNRDVTKRIFPDQFLAIKIMANEHFICRGLGEQLRTEVLCHLKCDHPNVVKCYFAYETASHVFLVLEGMMQSMKAVAGVCDENRVKSFCKQLLNAAIYLHSKNILHRDIKLDNILWNGDDAVKLSDFGWCADVTKGAPHDVCGSFQYMAPEVLRGGKQSGKVDVWSIGCCAFELLFGMPLFELHEIPARLTHVPINDWNRTEMMYQHSNNYMGTIERVCRYRNVSSGALDFLKYVLAADQNYRPTAAKAIWHPWLNPVTSNSPCSTSASETKEVQDDGYLSNSLEDYSQYKAPPTILLHSDKRTQQVS